MTDLTFEIHDVNYERYQNKNNQYEEKDRKETTYTGRWKAQNTGLGITFYLTVNQKKTSQSGKKDKIESKLNIEFMATIVDVGGKIDSTMSPGLRK